MSLNIKNEETCRLASELARLTGETMTGAIKVALTERLARETHLLGANDRLQKIHTVAASCAKLLRQGRPMVDHGDLLYDERGLPK